MGFNDMLNDGQPKAGTTLCSRTAFVHAVETVKNVVDVLFGNTDAIVCHFDEDVFVHIVKTDFGFAVFKAVFDGIENGKTERQPRR